MVRRRRNQAGLTLIELAIVLLIVGLLALVATPLTSSWGASADLHTAGGLQRCVMPQGRRVRRGLLGLFLIRSFVNYAYAVWMQVTAKRCCGVAHCLSAWS